MTREELIEVIVEAIGIYKQREKEQKHRASSAEDLEKRKEFHADVIEIINFLNLKTGKHFEPVSANIEIIAARLREGATVQECKSVIALKVRAWKEDEKLRIYLRPATLFNRTKFAQYKGELK